MALGGSDVLRLVIDADSSGATREFDKLGKSIKSSVGDAEKATSGFKGALSNAFDGLQSKSSTVSGIFDKIGLSSQQAAGAISAAIPAASIAAAGALVAFAAKGVQAFQETALAAGKFADSTGLSVDSASRYIAIADDIGVGASTIQNAFVKMEKAISSNRTAFGDLVVTGKNGATDLNATFLNVISHIQGIKDPIERANESSKLFGKGFAEVSQIIGTNVDTLKAKLAGVSSAQVITPAELAKARAFQAAMDDLKDSVRDVAVGIGGELVPQLTKLAKFASTTIEIAVHFKESKAGGFLSKINDIAGEIGANPFAQLERSVETLQAKLGDDGPAKSMTDGLGLIATSADRMGSAIGPAGNSIGDAARNFGIAEAKAHDLAAAYNDFQAGVSSTTAALREQNDAIAANSNAQLAAFDATFAVTNAQNDFATSLLAAESAAASGTASAGELQAAYDRETQAAEKVAQAVVTKAEKDAIASGTALTAKQSNDLLISTLQAQAAQASGPSKAALLGLVADLQKVGAQKPNPTVTVNDQASGPVRGIKDGLDGIKGKSVTVSVDTSGANANLTALRNRLNSAASQGVQVFAGGVKGVAFAHGGLVPGAQGQAVAATVHGGEYVLSADVVNRIKKGQPSSGAGPAGLPMGGGRTGQPIVFNISGAVDPYSTARQIQTILAKGGYAGFSAKAA